MEEPFEEHQSLKIFTRNPDEKFSAKKLIEFFNEIYESEKNFIDGFSAAENQGKNYKIEFLMFFFCLSPRFLIFLSF